MDLGLAGKTALVAASSQGLGRAIAEELIKEGANVMLASRNAEKLASVQQEISDAGPGRAAFVRGDLTNLEDIKKMVEQTVKEFGSLDILVNNSGGPPAGTFEHMTDEDWQSSFDLNLLSYIRLIRESIPYLRRNGGRILNIASSSIKEPIPGLILSNTFRTAVVGLSKTLSQELAPDIMINTLAPGRIATERVAHLDEFSAASKGIRVEEIQKQMKQLIPLGRYGEPVEFGKFAAFLLSDVNSYVTGQSFLIDGGSIKSI